MEKQYTNISHAPQLLLSRHKEEISIPSFPESIGVYLDTWQKETPAFSERHWHRSVQFNVVLEGTLEAFVGGRALFLEKGEGIFINSDVLHCLKQKGNTGCVCYSFQIPPSALCSERDIVLYGRYIAPVTGSGALDCMILKPDDGAGKEILSCLDRAFAEAQAQTYAYELKIKTFLLEAWICLLEELRKCSSCLDHPDGDEAAERMKAMVSFVRGSYREKIALGQIARAANVSQSECSRCFRRFLGTTPMEYVTQVRIAEACRLFETTELKPGMVGERTGFPDTAYFYRVFKKYMKCTPKEYQKKLRELPDTAEADEKRK